MATICMNYGEITSLYRQIKNLELRDKVMKETLDDIAKLVDVTNESGDDLIAKVALAVVTLRRIKLECRGHAEILAEETLEILFPNG